MLRNCPSLRAAPRILESFSTSRRTFDSLIKTDPRSAGASPDAARLIASDAAPKLSPAASPFPRSRQRRPRSSRGHQTHLRNETVDRDVMRERSKLSSGADSATKDQNRSARKSKRADLSCNDLDGEIFNRLGMSVQLNGSGRFWRYNDRFDDGCDFRRR